MKISGFNEWLAFKATAKSYFELFKKESLVYLTADSPNTITQLSRDKVRMKALALCAVRACRTRTATED